MTDLMCMYKYLTLERTPPKKRTTGGQDQDAGQGAAGARVGNSSGGCGEWQGGGGGVSAPPRPVFGRCVFGWKDGRVDISLLSCSCPVYMRRGDWGGEQHDTPMSLIHHTPANANQNQKSNPTKYIMIMNKHQQARGWTLPWPSPAATSPTRTPSRKWCVPDLLLAWMWVWGGWGSCRVRGMPLSPPSRPTLTSPYHHRTQPPKKQT